MKNYCFLAAALYFLAGYVQAQDACIARSDFDWDDRPGNPDGRTYTDEGVNFSFTLNDPNNRVDNGLFEPSGFYGATTLRYYQDLRRNEFSTLETRITNTSLYDFCLLIYGLNGDDVVTVSGSNNGSLVSNSRTIVGYDPFYGVPIYRYCFGGPIDRFDITLESSAGGNPPAQGIGVGDFTWCDIDFDDDNILDASDPDSDGDGVLDSVEDSNASADTDGDGIPNYADTDFPGFTDTDGNGVNDSVDPDNDGSPNSLDIDSDGDGIVDNIEAQSTVAYVAPANNDADNNGLDDAYDGAPITIVNTDGTGNPDYLDLDSDDDGVSDLIEGNDIDANGVVDIVGGAVSGDDSDGDGLDDSFDAVNGRGRNNNAVGRNTVPANLVDDDDEYNFRDTDDDGDGVLTSAELADSNGDGRPEYIQACEDGSILDFEDYTVGNTPGPVFSVDGVNITFDFQDASGNVTAYDIEDDIHNEHYVEIGQDLESNTQTTLLKIKFNHPLEGFCFDLLDIDQALPNWIDSMSVNIFRDGDVIVLNGGNILTGYSNELLDNNFIVGNTSSEDDEYFGNVRICLGQTVDSLTIRYADASAPSGFQKVGLNDFTWCGIDSDFDEILDFTDNDDNNNGIPDIVEAGNIGIDPSADADGDKIPNYRDTDFAGYADTDANGVDDRFDYDGDGVPDHLDLDTDNDGIPDAVEANGGTLPANMNTDGRYPASYAQAATDADSDGILTELDPDEGGTALANPNSDGDAVPDFRDKDSDNDGLTDAVEAGAADDNGDGYVDNYSDEDNDGYHDVHDPDFFGTELLEGALVRRSRRSDGDTFPDYRDQDADGDGIIDNVEAQTTAGYAAPGITDTDSDGLLDDYDTDSGNTALTPVNTDGDARADYRDTDSDDDGVGDRTEGRDADSNGIVDVSPANRDTDNDGLDDNYDPDSGGSLAPVASTDADNLPDYRDTDDDNDGVLTENEDANGNNNYRDDFTQGGSPTPDYLFNSDDPDGDTIPNDVDQDDNNDGILDVDQSYGADPSADHDSDGTPNHADPHFVHPTYGAFVDSNGDGINDIFDVDRDGIPNHFDLDSDGDGIPNAYEANNTVLPANMAENGQYPATYAQANDDDSDGVVNAVDPDFSGSSPLPNQDRDGDGFADGLDQDADGDAIPDRLEAGGTDTNNDGYNDEFRDSDGDLAPDYRDQDADADGIPDLVEAQTTAGFATATGIDTDRDGIDNAFDSDNSGTDITGNDHDGDGTPDYRDTDSDNDSISDAIEGNDANGDGTADTSPTTNDTDQDGLDNRFDTDNGGTVVPRQNTDGDAEPDYRDNNDDGDNILTFDETTDENPNNGTPDYLEASSETCGNGFVTGVGYGREVTASNGASRTYAAIGTPNYTGSGDNRFTLAYTVATGNFIELDLGQMTPGGSAIDLYLTSNAAGSSWIVTSSQDGTTFANAATYSGLPERPDPIAIRTYSVPVGGIRYLRFDWNGGTPYLDGVTFTCVPDKDNDAIADSSDNDSDNDGLSDVQEGNGTDPTADFDGDGIPNYLDTSLASFEDTNGDGVSDIFDFDRDGIANHLDLDSDNDGIPDAVEANNGALPAHMSTEGAYPLSYVLANDTDSDGYANDVDGSPLTNPDTDGDGLNDFIDRDSDNDGITDPLEAGGADMNRDGILDGFADTDNDGLPDSVDPDNGGVAINPINTDGTDQPDYLDTDSDNDSGGVSPGLPDVFEGHDSNFDGTPSWDDNSNLMLDANEGNIDQDRDGILDAFDPSEGGIGASLPDVDRDGRSNHQDNDDDDDGILTQDEDANGNGNFFDDKTEGQAGTQFAHVPNYLYNPIAPLPVELIDFSIYWNREAVVLRWKTASERDNDRFEIQRSTDGAHFSTIGTVKGQGTTTDLTQYEYMDVISQGGVFYYRLKQLDFNGGFEYSPTKYVLIEAAPVSATVYPNPVKDKFTVKVSGTRQPATYMLFDTMGRAFSMGTFSEQETIDISRMPTGKYILRLRGDRLLESISILKVPEN